MGIIKDIAMNMDKLGVYDLTLVVDGCYYLHSNKMVHVLCQKDRISFYVNSRESENSKEGIKLTGDLNVIARQNHLYGKAIADEFTADLKLYNIQINTQMGYLIIESPLYRIIKTIIESNETNVDVIIPGTSITISAESIAEYIELFMSKSYSNYKAFLDSKISRKVVQKLLKAHRFYQLQRVFVPVFINIEGIFNPLKAFNQNRKIENSALYKKALETDRHIEIDGLSCYMLTHKEICESLHISNFIRMSAYFVYCIYVGLMVPPCAEFPSNAYPMYIDMEIRQGNRGRRFFTEAEYIEKLQIIKRILDAPDLQEEDRKKYLAKVEYLQNFRKGSSLQVFCFREYNILQYAPITGDRRISELELASYFATIKL